ncbi:LuxR C-terminal-related transcriptional regulator [Actinoplanes sp. NPDC049265]|uniref:helix-turn-helix transcriptional regulator n=1 Tax=Actinoplanes sp. NPDC049265 TaxID=3363902 RepID=UPI0037201EA9
MEPTLDREIVHDVAALRDLPLTSRELCTRIGSRLARRLTADAFCFGTIDPVTLLVTDHVTDGIPADTAPAAAHNEYLVDDVLKFAELAGGKVSAGVLSAATGGEPTRSHRYRALLPLIDARHELRAAFVVGGRCWGNVSLYRSGRRQDFSGADVELLRRLSATVGGVLRGAAHRSAAANAGLFGESGVLVLGRDLTLVTANPAAQRWLAELDRTQGLPIAVLDVAARSSHTALPAYGRVRGASGRWLAVQASPLTGGEYPAHLAVLVYPAPASEVTDVMALAYGLTRRECDVLAHVLSGKPSRTIAGLLHITTATVQDHLKAIFAKVGVHSRGELTARMLNADFGID